LKRTNHPVFPTKQEIIDYFKTANGKAARRDIARHFGVKGDERAKLRALLKELQEENALEKEGKKRFTAPGILPPVLPIDIMSVDENGDLVATPSNWRAETEPPVIRITMKEAAKKNPLPGVGDRILARVALAENTNSTTAGDTINIPDHDKNLYEAKIIKAIGKGATRFLGVFKKASFGGIIDPVERRSRGKFTVDKEHTRGAKDGALVWAETVSHRGSATRARVREIEGHIDDQAAYSLIALANHNIPIEFPTSVMNEADNATLPQLSDRTDLRDLPLLTIDPADAKDHDDAVWAAPDKDADNENGFKVIVAIADVSWFVRPGSELDQEALKRGNSTYLPDRVVPMLPERLSNDLCSLMEGVDRPCLAVEITLSKDGFKKSHRFMRAMMRSAASLSYEDAQKLIDTPKKGGVEETVTHLFNAYSARMKEREKRAPLDLDLPERKIILDKKSNVKCVEKRERFDAHKLIEEFMILANVAAAETIEQAKLTQIYRSHDVPDPEKLDGVRNYLHSLDYSLVKGGSLRPNHFNQLLEIAASRDEKEMVSEVVLRSQQQAIYSTENLGHFGLNLARYSHFTSPIRRYADLTIHRALVKACHLGEGGQTSDETVTLARVAGDISDLERRSMAAERESKDRYLAGYLEQRIGDEFSARIRGVTRFGLFVMLDETGADGFIPMRSIGFERFNFDEDKHAVIGQTTGGFYRLGQAVDVRLAEAAPITGGLRFDLITDPIVDPDFKRSPRNTSAKSGTTKKKGRKKIRKDAGKPKAKKKNRRKANAKARSD